MNDAASVLANEAHGPGFFDRVRQRLSLSEPAALRDPAAPAVRGQSVAASMRWS